MRTGVLSDAHIRKHSPELFLLDARTHSNIYERPRLTSNDFYTKKQKLRRHRPIVRPRAPYMHHHELAKMMNPLNPKEVHESFGEKLEAIVNAKPSPSFNSVVEKHNIAYPFYATTRGMLPENAYFLSQMNLNPIQHFGQSNRFGRFPSGAKMARPLVDFVEKLREDLRGSGDSDALKKLEEVFDQTLDEMSKVTD